ncbi:hypothetical protein GM3708_227 [Geminocystis sp. NIES-3708]|nr:hypothetical protein GM3708_227 [Geminocystis sp. NIES-3708]
MMLIDKIIQELHQILSENLIQIYELFHQMCLEINQENQQPPVKP